MKGGTVQILWHGSDPILSVDFHHATGLLATAGADRDIKLWSLHHTEKSKALPSATFKANLSYHGAAVNVLRFSPSGELLASGADNGELLIWRITEADEEIPSWKVWKTLRFHHKDVLDVGWSQDGTFLLSGSVDNTCIIWNVEKGSVEQVLADHQHYVQGVTWDPVGKYVASLSGDRTCRIYSLQSLTKKTKSKDKNLKMLYTCQHVLSKKDASGFSAVGASLDINEASQKQGPPSKQYLFYDENMPSFFRRLSWSPDGSFLLIPSGVDKRSPDGAPYSVSYIVSRNDLSRPALQLPAASKAAVAGRFCPIIYSLSSKMSWKHDTIVPGVGAFKLPYRLVFAVATLNSVFIYDTEQSCPIAMFAGLHYAPITDLAWSSDAKFLAVSSQDGYCTLVGFDEGDLGTPLSRTDLPSSILNLLPGCVLAGNQRGSAAVSPGKDASDHSTDPSLSEPGELLGKMSTLEKDLSAGIHHMPGMSIGKSLKKQLDSHVKPLKIRRINPKPILGYLQKSTELNSDSSLAIGDSDYVVDNNQRFEGVDSSSGLSNSGSGQESSPLCGAVGMETS